MKPVPVAEPDFAAEIAAILPPDTPNRDHLIALGARHLSLVVATNRTMNLTRITAAREAAIKHILDSVLPWPLLQSAHSIADIGSGAGFPGLPLAILFPTTRVTLVESIQKKARFLAEAVQTLNLKNVQIQPHRGEEVLRHQCFDTLVARALAPLPKILQTLGPHLSRVSRLILYKGPDIDQELEKSQTLLQRFHLECRFITRHQLPDDAGERAIVELVRRP